jgi:hypothetical protein
MRYGKTLRRFIVELVLILLTAQLCMAAPTLAAASAFDRYIGNLERRLRAQHSSAESFVVASPATEQRLRAGELVIEKLNPETAMTPGAMLHHWRGTAFVPGATVADFERLMQDFTAYPQHYRPQVIGARVLTHSGDHYQTLLRVRQHHVLTVVMDTTYEIDFGRLDAAHGFSVSRSTRVAEIEGAGTRNEHALGSDEEHGFLWRLNTYWSYREGDGGLYMQIESASLTRNIPRGLGWMIGPFVESIPRESLEFTLRATRDALLKEKAK